MFLSSKDMKGGYFVIFVEDDVIYWFYWGWYWLAWLHSTMRVRIANIDTPPKFNIAPENRESQKETHLPTIHFQGRAVKLPGGTIGKGHCSWLMMHFCPHQLRYSFDLPGPPRMPITPRLWHFFLAGNPNPYKPWFATIASWVGG